MVTDQQKNLFNNRLVENVSTIQLIAIIRKMFSPRLHRHLSVVFFFLSSFPNEFVSIAYCVPFFPLQIIRTPFQFSVSERTAVAVIFLCLCAEAYEGVNCAAKK